MSSACRRGESSIPAAAWNRVPPAARLPLDTPALQPSARLFSSTATTTSGSSRGSQRRHDAAGAGARDDDVDLDVLLQRLAPSVRWISDQDQRSSASVTP